MSWHFGDAIDAVRAAAWRLEEADDDIGIAAAFGERPTEEQRREMLGWLTRAKKALDRIDVG